MSLLMIVLAASWQPIILAASHQDSPPVEPREKETVDGDQITPSPSGDEDLQWQPGLGMPLEVLPVRQTARDGSIPATPAIAWPIAGAQPIPALSPSLSAPSLAAPGTPPEGIDNGRPNPEDVMLFQPAPWPVMPSAFLEPAGETSGAGSPNPDQPQVDSAGSAPADGGITDVTRGMESLPNSAGQVWRTYDISPYTYLVQNVAAPEQAVIDWILKETGTGLWFTQPLGVLSASRNQLHVYHTPEIQNRIKPIIDRFVNSRAAPQVVGLRLATIASPNWRSTALSMMRPIPIDSPGVEGWLMSRENAAILAGQLRQRADFTERNNGDIVVTDGQKYILSQTRPIEFLRSLAWVNEGTGYYQPVNDRIDEGYTVEFSTLGSLDGQSIEAIIGCKINQIEKLQPVSVQLAGLGGQVQTAELQVPQMVSWQVSERFRWPSDQVLVLSCGVVATPGPQRQALMGLPAILNDSRGRADAIMFIEYKGRASLNSTAAPANAAAGQMLPVDPRR